MIYTGNSVFYRSAHSNINDSTGLLFSCDGYKIYDKQGMLMEGGTDLIPSKIVNSGVNQKNQQSIILPKGDNQFYVFIWSISDENYDKAFSQGGWYIYDILTYSVVDLKLNKGLGKVISKLNYLLNDQNDSLSSSQMSAVRHANGRDWWLVKPHFTKHKFYTFLIKPNGIVRQPDQEFDSPSFLNGVNGQSNFSLDGSLYVMTSTYTSMFTQVNYFDRCTGKMTKYKSIPRPYEPAYSEGAKIAGACFSEDNRFVYLVNNNFVYQYDLGSDEIIEIHTDSLFNTADNSIAFNSPDGRIYIGNVNGIANAISYIEYPNLKGKGAHYCPLCYQTKNNNTKSPPNMPNYELGALIGSPCDTIGKIYSTDMLVYPNPAGDNVTVFVPAQVKTNTSIYFYNAMGQVVLHEQQISDDKQKIYLNLKHLAKGVYNLKVEVGDVLYVKKLVRN